MTDTDPQSQIDELSPPPDPREATLSGLCTFGPPAERKRQWMLVFEDADRSRIIIDNEAEAKALFKKACSGWNCTLFVTAEFPDPREAEIAELRAELASYKKSASLATKAKDEARAQLAKAATALEPFAKEAKAYAHVADDVHPLYITTDGDEMDADFTAGDLRTAAAVLRELQAVGVRG